MTGHTPGESRFIGLDPNALAKRLTRAADEELLIGRMALAVQDELGRPLAPAEVADVHASAADLLTRLRDYARLPAARQLELADVIDDDGEPA
jgi:hypothetical protein